MGTVSYGEEKATRGAETEADWARDRRADLVRTN
jgi:outer membrane protein OmpA-like peptidoglycan-associated protein